MRLVGVYDADGSVIGEVSYFVRARLGQSHCSLCAVTHGRVRERSDWQRCRDELPVPFATHHRDDQPDRVRQAGGPPPFVLGETAAGDLVRLLDRRQLDACGGSPARLTAALREAAREAGLRWPV